MGAVFGSFLNAAEWRIHREVPLLSRKRSECPRCGELIPFFLNIPIISFLVLRGSCRFCKKKISKQYIYVELALAFLFALAVFVKGGFESWSLLSFVGLLRDWFIIGIFSFIFLYDFKYGQVLDSVTLLGSLFISLISAGLGLLSWTSMAWGALLGSGFFFIQFIISKGKWIGGGDLRIGLFMGVALGWPLVAVALFLSYTIGALFSLVSIVFGKKQMTDKVAFGTYLSVGSIIALFWGDSLLNWYLSLL